jgi:hypothetical protein
MASATNKGIEEAASSYKSAIAAEGCPKAQAETLTAFQVQTLTNPNFPPELEYAMCVMDPRSRRELVNMVYENGVVDRYPIGLDVFVDHFGRELAMWCPSGICNRIPNDRKKFDEDAASFFRARTLFADFTLHQQAYRRLMTDYSNIPASGDGLKLVLAERAARLEAILEAFFGLVKSTTITLGTFWIELDEVDKAITEKGVHLFDFSESTESGPPIRQPANPNPMVRLLDPWPKDSQSRTDAGRREVRIKVKQVSKPSQGVVNCPSGTEKPLKDQLIYREPHTYTVSVVSAAAPQRNNVQTSVNSDNILEMQDMQMSQGGICETISLASGNTNIGLDPLTGALTDISISRSARLNSSMVDQLGQLATGAISSLLDIQEENSPENRLRRQLRLKWLDECANGSKDAKPTEATCAALLK